MLTCNFGLAPPGISRRYANQFLQEFENDPGKPKKTFQSGQYSSLGTQPRRYIRSGYPLRIERRPFRNFVECWANRDRPPVLRRIFSDWSILDAKNKLDSPSDFGFCSRCSFGSGWIFLTRHKYCRKPRERVGLFCAGRDGVQSHFIFFGNSSSLEYCSSMQVVSD